MALLRISKLHGWLAIVGLVDLGRDVGELDWPQWKKVLYRTRAAMGSKNLGMLAAGIAYYGTLAFFPLMVLLLSVAALFITPERFTETVTAINTYVPRDIGSLITTQLEHLIDKPIVSVSAAIIALLIALWSVSAAAENIIRALNVAYGVSETRSFVRIKKISFALTVGIVFGVLAVVMLLGGSESFLIFGDTSGTTALVWSMMRWVVLIGLILIAVDLLYHFVPNRETVRFRWASWGAVVATALWVIVTAVLFIYLRYFSNFSDSYSLFAGIIALMIWLNLSAMTFLIGAEVNQHTR